MSPTVAWTTRAIVMQTPDGPRVTVVCLRCGGRFADRTPGLRGICGCHKHHIDALRARRPRR
jgi:hypothetical protein